MLSLDIKFAEEGLPKNTMSIVNFLTKTQIKFEMMHLYTLTLCVCLEFRQKKNTTYFFLATLSPITKISNEGEQKQQSKTHRVAFKNGDNRKQKTTIVIGCTGLAYLAAGMIYLYIFKEHVTK